MKILWIGNFFDGSGWSRAAIQYILALDSVGVNVVPRTIKLNPNWDKEVSQKIIDLSKKSSENCTIVIQNTLPSMMEFNGNFRKNIGLSYFETSNFRQTDWTRHINLMDEMWVPCQFNQQVCLNSGVTIPTKIVPIPVDVSKYEQKYDKLKIPELKGKFVFYFIGELNRRKNIESLLKAFHTTFKPNEDVSLVLKVNIPSFIPEQTSQVMAKIIKNVKEGLKLYKNIETYIPEVVITGNLSGQEIMQLHYTCDCFVCPSYGESWSMPTMDSMAMGRTPIVTNNAGMNDYIKGKDYIGGILVKSHDEIIFDAPCAVENLCTGYETWKSIDIIDLGKTMREVYQNDTMRKQYAEDGINGAYNYSYEKVGMIMKGLLENVN
jgi:glycosyltransferase involved in cell wall biosynthesis